MDRKENKILIISGGQVEPSFVSDRVKTEQYSMIIAADYGLVLANQLGLSLDFIVGDFDSVPESVLRIYREKSIPIKTFPKEKDKTDTQIAIELALMYNPTKLHIVGATGSRLDHTLANLHLLLLPMQLNIDACILNQNNKLYLKQESFQILKREQFGDFVSLLPFSEKVSGLTLNGFKYPLDRIILTAGNSLGISNEIVADTAQIEFNEGILLVMETKD
jgi:thiamine pyrophosphokinase